MSLPSLFIKDYKGTDSGMTRMPREEVEWTPIVVGQINEVLGDDKEYVISVNFTKSDSESGTAIGAALIFDTSANKGVYVPIIIKEFKMFPLDILLKNDQEGELEAYPFSEDSVEEALQSGNPFTHLEKPVDRIQQMYFNPQSTAINPPSSRNAYASSGIIDSIAHTIDNESKEEFFNFLRENEGVLAGFHKRAHLDLLMKIAESKLEEKQIPDPDKGIALVKSKEGRLNSVYTDDEVYDPIIEDIDRVEAESTIPKDTLHDIDRTGEKIVSDKMTPDATAMISPYHSPENYQEFSEGVADSSSYGNYYVYDKGGKKFKGTVYPTVISFDMKKTESKLFTNGERFSLQENIPGEMVENEVPEINRKVPVVGEVGSFVFADKRGAIATTPFTVEGFDPESKKILASTLMGEPLVLCMSTEDLMRIAKVGGKYLIPPAMVYISLGSPVDINDNVQSIVEKKASFSRDANPVRIIHTGHGLFSLKGPDMDKMASLCNWNSTCLTPGETVFLLASKRLPMSKVATVLKGAAKYSDGMLIHGLPRTVFGEDIEKTAQPYLRPVNLIKEASVMDDAQTVDGLLALNFANEDNAKMFSEYLPLFEMTTQKLAYLTLAGRLGVKGISYEDTKSAMMKLNDVIKELKSLKLKGPETDGLGDK